MKKHVQLPMDRVLAARILFMCSKRARSFSQLRSQMDVHPARLARTIAQLCSQGLLTKGEGRRGLYRTTLKAARTARKSTAGFLQLTIFNNQRYSRQIPHVTFCDEPVLKALLRAIPLTSFGVP